MTLRLPLALRGMTTRDAALAGTSVLATALLSAFVSVGVGLAAGVLALVTVLGRRGGAPVPAGDVDSLTRLPRRDGAVAALDDALAVARRTGQATGALVVELDRFKLLEERYDHAAIGRILQVTADRIGDILREGDVAARLEGPAFAIALRPVRRLDLEAAIQLAGRIQRALAEPISVDGCTVYVTASIGFGLASRLPSPTGETLMQAASSAMIEAQRNGPGAIRSYSEAMRARIANRNSLAEEVRGALDRGEIRAYFQPQLSARTGEITGFETLARWVHPTRGMIPPVEFLPALHQAAAMDRLCEVMVGEALSALRGWDAAGLEIPRVGVNFSTEELSDPRLVDRIAWDLDRFDIAPERLVVEVLETVVADKTEDVVIRNLSGLARLGCCLDLDDFGTGHAAITNIRRFSIRRIKIDRSFVTRIDEDTEQQKMVSAILTMADRLGLDTLAEGVETEAERSMLDQLGCHHVQGFGISRPMPRDEAEAWIRHRRAQLSAPIPLASRVQ